MSSHVRVSLLQIEPRGQQARTDFFEAVADSVREVAGSDLIVLPELWDVGYFAFDDYAAEAEPLGGPTTQRLSDLAREVGAVLHAGSILERDEVTGSLYNTSLVFSPRGELLGDYRKMHVFGYRSRERELVAGGAEPASFPFGLVEVGLAICYDLRFPELFRWNVDRLAMHIVPATWPAARVEHWRALLIARAIENQTFVIGCNAAGWNGGVELGGFSVIIDPAGHVLAEAASDPAVLTADIDLDEVAATRADFPALSDRVLTREATTNEANGELS